jgi:hypothetical protein
MPRYTPEEIAAAQAAIKRQPKSATIVDAPYDLVDVTGQAIKKGTPVWRWVSNHPGGPMDAYAVDRLVEYDYRSLESARRLGWKEVQP